MKFDINQKLLAHSWKQPYAELMLHGKIETRRWATSYRGWVMICASKKAYTREQFFNISGEESGIEAMQLLNKNPDNERWYHIMNNFHHSGVAIAIGRLVECVSWDFKESSKIPVDDKKTFVKYYPDLYLHIYEDVKPIVPIPWKGTQGWKEVPMETKKQIQIL